MADKASTEVTSVGDVEIDYAFNSWVLAQCRGRSAQRQVRSADDLGELLIEVGVPMREARELGAGMWRSRPRDALLRSARPWEAPWRGTGLRPGYSIALAFFGPVLIGLFFVLLFWLLY